MWCCWLLEQHVCIQEQLILQSYIDISNTVDAYRNTRESFYKHCIVVQ